MELFAGAAHYYARYRLPYPAALFDRLTEQFGLDRASRVLDLGTGTGQLALPLAARCGEVVALDISPQMVAEARRAARECGATNIRWLVGAAEELPPDLGLFQLVTVAQAFHWMDREAVLRHIWRQLAPGGGIALVGMGTIWGAPEPWAQAATDTVRRWLGAERRAGSGTHGATPAAAHKPFAVILTDGGFVRVTRNEFTIAHRWDLDAIVGYLYSTSYCRPDLLGERRAAFEDDLRRALLEIEPTGLFEQAIWVDYTLGWHP